MDTKSTVKERMSFLWGKLEGNSLYSAILAFTIVVALSITFTRNVSQWFDLTISDDNDYMAGGLRMGDELMNNAFDWNPDWAPLYRLWFFFLSKATPDVEGMFYSSLRLVGMLVPVLMYLVLQRARVAPLFAAGVSLLFLTTYANWFPEPRVMNFAFLVLLLAWWIASFFPHRWQRLCVLALLSLFMAYIRPEFFLSTLLLVFIAVIYLVHSLWKRRIQLSTREKALVTGMTGIFILFLFWWGVPFSDDRSIYAFGQHYARNAVSCLAEAKPDTIPWEEILARDFGEPTSIVQAYFNNPRAFEKHVLCNVQNFPKRFLSVTFVNAWTNSWFLIKLFLTIIIWRLLFHWRSIKAQLQWLLERDMLLLGMVGLVPAGLSILLIFPREHYVAFFSLLTFMLTTMTIGAHESNDEKRLTWRKTLVGGVLLMALFPSMGGLFDSTTPEKPIQVTVHEIKGLNASEPIRMLATRPFQVDFAQVYFDSDFVAIPFKPYDVTFQDFFLEYEPNVILITRDGREFADDPTWEEFQSNFQADGFREIVLNVEDPWGPWRLYVKDGLGR